MKSPGRYRELLRPGRIGRLELKNRIVMAPMGTGLASRAGLVTERLKGYLEERARGGAGLIMVEITAVDHPRGVIKVRQLGISDDRFLPGLAELAGAVHGHGARIGIQLHHGGGMATPLAGRGHEAAAPSPVPFLAGATAPRELTPPEIGALVRCYARAAARARAAGIDGVEIHAGHGYLINQFLSRSRNKRQDAYGGSLVNRARFLLEVIGAIRAEVGAAYPVWCRLNGREFAIQDGLSEEDGRAIARMAASAGVDAIHVSGYGGFDGVHFTEAPLVNEPGYLAPLARDIKRLVAVPVIAVGRISPEMGESILRRGDADFIAMGRPLIADPDLPNKLASGNTDDIRKCIYCYSCVHQSFVQSAICCSVNGRAGNETEPLPAPAAQPKKVLVVGGGPAGMEAARVAASRGHDVTLCEKGGRLGGSLLLASLVRKENGDLVSYLAGQLRKLKVEVKTEKMAASNLVEELGPAALIVATGAARRDPPIPGISRRNVLSGDDLRGILCGRPGPDTAGKLTGLQKTVLRLARPFLRPVLIRRMSRVWMPVGRRVAIMGGGIVGSEVAAFLAERGRKVTIIESGDEIATDMALPLRWITLDRLSRNGVVVLTGARCDEIVDAGVSVTARDGSRRMVGSDTVLVATGAEPDEGALPALRGSVVEAHVAGDCAGVGYIRGAIAGGARAGAVV